MIVRENTNKQYIIFDPEDIKERKALDKFPGFLKEGLSFFSPNKQLVIKNLLSRLLKTPLGKNLKTTPYVQQLFTSKFQLKALPSSFSFFTKPLPHQELALQFAVTNGSCGLLLEPGLGKTKIVLDYIHLMQFPMSIIICPKPLLSVWPEEAVKHRPELSVYVVQTTDWEKELKKIKEMSAKVVVVNYDKAVILLQELSSLKAHFVGLDEGLIKNYKTERTKEITRLGKGIPYKMVMSGTLINNSPLDTFAPIRFIEPSLLGEGVTKFKERYEIVSMSNKNIPLGYRDIPEIRATLEACSIVMRKQEWLKDLPKKVFHEIYVQPCEQQKDWYRTLAGNWLLLKEKTRLEYDVEVDLALTALVKLNQISNGFLYYRENLEEELLQDIDAPAPKRAKPPNEVYYFKEQPKVDKLLEILDDPNRLKGKRTIVWFNLGAERVILEKAFEENKITYLTIAGGEKHVGEKVSTFNNDSSIRICLCQAKTINYGVTLIGRDSEEDVVNDFDPRISDEVFYSLNFSLEVYLQQQDRIHRIGQTKECNYWMLLCNTPVDRKVYAALQDKQELNKTMLIDISKQTEV